MQTVIGLTIQCAGILLITILSTVLTRSIRRLPLDYWTLAWVCLSASLTSLAAAFAFPALRLFFQPIYFLGEYAFGFLFIAGCRNYASGVALARRDWRWLVPGLALAFGLTLLPASFYLIFAVHAAAMSVLFALSYRALKKARRGPAAGPGMKVMLVALALLALGFLHYVPIMLYAYWHPGVHYAYMQYTAIYDLILEIMLGFGTVMVVMEDVRGEVEAANAELRAARDRLEVLARIDPLTEALNRHAFYSLLDKTQQTRRDAGCVVVMDIDNLKPINDSFGHTAGDAAIRAVARAIRSVIRADDLLFRWGGDEFLILFFGVSEVEVRRRIAEIDRALAEVQLPGSPGSIQLIVSHGFAVFNDISGLEHAIEQADGAMYARKQARKQAQLRGAS